MAWRLLMRRCPTRSMTLVGDVAQTGDAGRRLVLGARCSSRTSATAGGWTELTVNYRTPAEIMAVAAERAGRDRPGAARRRARCGRPAYAAVAPRAGPARWPAGWSATGRRGGGRGSATAGSA